MLPSRRRDGSFPHSRGVGQRVSRYLQMFLGIVVTGESSTNGNVSSGTWSDNHFLQEERAPESDRHAPRDDACVAIFRLSPIDYIVLHVHTKK